MAYVSTFEFLSYFQALHWEFCHTSWAQKVAQCWWSLMEEEVLRTAPFQLDWLRFLVDYEWIILVYLRYIKSLNVNETWKPISCNDRMLIGKINVMQKNIFIFVWSLWTVVYNLNQTAFIWQFYWLKCKTYVAFIIQSWIINNNMWMAKSKLTLLDYILTEQ